jgi:hypothetical protein
MRFSLLTGFVAIYIVGLYGCSQRPVTTPAGEAAAAAEHGHEGPHGGHIIELGAPGHHAELTHEDASHRVGVYILDGQAKAAVPIAAESVTINVAEDGEPTAFVLPAVPQSGDGEGRASYFELVSEPLCKVICGESEAETTTARVSVTIEGKPFVGIIDTEPHDHDHGHDHGHAH